MFLDSTADLTMDYIILIVVIIDKQSGLMGWSSSREMPIPWQQESDDLLLYNFWNAHAEFSFLTA